MKEKIIFVKTTLLDEGGYISGFQYRGLPGSKGIEIEPEYKYEILKEDFEFLKNYRQFHPDREVREKLGEEFMNELEAIYEAAMEFENDSNKYYVQYKKMSKKYDEVKTSINLNNYIKVIISHNDELKDNLIKISFEKVRNLAGIYKLK